MGPEGGRLHHHHHMRLRPHEGRRPRAREVLGASVTKRMIKMELEKNGWSKRQPDMSSPDEPSTNPSRSRSPRGSRRAPADVSPVQRGVDAWNPTLQEERGVGRQSGLTGLGPVPQTEAAKVGRLKKTLEASAQEASSHLSSFDKRIDAFLNEDDRDRWCPL